MAELLPQIGGFHMPDKRENSQSADKDQLLAHKSSPKDGQYGEFKEMFPENAVEYFVS